MAVTKIPQGTTLTLRLNAGMNAAGKPIVKQVHFQGVKYDATDDDVLAIANSLASLQSLTVLGVNRVDTASLASS